MMLFELQLSIIFYHFLINSFTNFFSENGLLNIKDGDDDDRDDCDDNHDSDNNKEREQEDDNEESDDSDRDQRKLLPLHAV